MMRSILKRLSLIIAMIVLAPLVAIYMIIPEKYKDEVFCTIGTFLSLIPGKLGSYIRLGYYKYTLNRISSDVAIGFGSFFSKRTAQVGNFVSIGAYSIIGNANLGDYTLISSRVSITSGKHQHGNSLGGITDEISYDKINIGEKTWIGENAVVMADVGKNCIISAGSIITRQIPENCLVVGNPGRVIKHL